MNKKQYTLDFKNRMSELGRLNRNWEEIGSSLYLSAKCIFEVNLALDELFTNIVSYGFRDNQKHIIKIRISLESDKLQVMIEDDGVPFNPLHSKTPDFQGDIEDCQIGGIGIHLVIEMMDDIQYQRIADRNIVLLTKKIQWEDGG